MRLESKILFTVVTNLDLLMKKDAVIVVLIVQLTKAQPIYKMYLPLFVPPENKF